MGYKITIRDLVALGLGLAFINIGIDHFINPVWYEPIVPSLLGDANFWVLARVCLKSYSDYCSSFQLQGLGFCWRSMDAGSIVLGEFQYVVQ